MESQASDFSVLFLDRELCGYHFFLCSCRRRTTINSTNSFARAIRREAERVAWVLPRSTPVRTAPLVRAGMDLGRDPYLSLTLPLNCVCNSDTSEFGDDLDPFFYLLSVLTVRLSLGKIEKQQFIQISIRFSINQINSVKKLLKS